MKKIAIISAGAIALTMLPVSGVFAAESVTDTVTVTISSACEFSSADDTKAVSITNGTVNSNIQTRALTFSCNDAGGWVVSAIGAGQVSGDVTKMKPSGNGTAIATGTATSGATSNWAFKVTGTGTLASTFRAIPSTATNVAKGTGSVSGSTLQPVYQVWISATQQADTYTGKVTYTLAHPAPTS